MTKAQAVKEVQSGNASTKAFKALGFPLEYFLRYCQFDESQEKRFIALVEKHFGE